MAQISGSDNREAKVEDQMTFEEWMNTEFSRDYLPRELASLAWDYQQERIDFLETMTENQQLIIANLHEELALADNRPMVKSDYFERIEELEKQVEWHKRRAEGWRSIAVLEAQEKNT